MVENNLKKRLRSGETVIGLWSIIPSPVLMEIFGSGGLDFVILDMEHGVYNVQSVDDCIRSCSSSIAPLVRVPGADASAIQWALDLGSSGVVIPQISGFIDALNAVGMTKFSPEGTRGYNPFTRAGNYSAATSSEMGKLNNAYGLTTVIVENEKSLSVLQEICSIPSLDVIYIGVFDLAVSLGLKGNVRHPAILDIVDDAIKVILGAGKTVGLMCRDAKEVKAAKERGVNFIVYGVDTQLVMDSVLSAVRVVSEN
jgi:4-hydroxy-2-oxoheptanedioate aldolase